MVRNIKQPSTLSQELILLEVFTGKWTIVTVLALEHGQLRHSQLQRQLPGISQKVLTQTLRMLEKNGILTRKVFPVVPPHVEYSLTPMGRSLVQIVRQVGDWAKANQPEALEARHTYASVNETQ